jgi:hypothetical protein
MSRALVCFAVACLALAPAAAEAQYFFENFDSYANGSDIIGQGGWDGWDGGAYPAYVTNFQSYSSPNSLSIVDPADVVQQFSGISSGSWWARVRVYIPSGQTGDAYFIMLNTYSPGGTQNWSSQLRFSASEGIVESVGGSDNPHGETAAIVTDQWTEVWIEIDLDSNLQTVYYEGVAMGSAFAWTVTGNAEIAAFDLFSDGSSEAYMDDVYLDTEFPVELMAFTVE